MDKDFKKTKKNRWTGVSELWLSVGLNKIKNNDTLGCGCQNWLQVAFFWAAASLADASECPYQTSSRILSSLIASEVEHYSVRDFQGLIFYQHNVIWVQVQLLPLLHLEKKTPKKLGLY